MKEAIPPYLSALNDKQMEAVVHEGRPLLILAGAGSGKTRVITTKIAYLIDRKGVDPASILAVTFTNKAAGEMLERVRGMVPHARGVMIRTFHSFGAWVLRRNSALAGLPPTFSIYDEDDSLSLLHSLYEQRKKRDLKQYIHWISRAKDYALTPEDDLSKISYHQDLPDLYRAYQDRLHEIGNVDFGDLIMKPVELLRDQKSVRERLRQRFRIILVDEYQDSNVAQFHLLEYLYGEETYLCVVGDDDQSIYRFRGAEIQNILQFPEIFPGTDIIKLEENYRSTGNILSIASAVVANNTGRLGKKLWTRNLEGRQSVFVQLENQRAEVEYCADLLTDGNLRETAILYRTNAQSREFEIYFSRNHIPYHLVGTVSFYSREEVKDTIAWLHFLHNRRDEIAWRRIINKPSRGIGKATIEKIISRLFSAGGDCLEACRLAAGSLSSKAAKATARFVETADALCRKMEELDLQDFILTLLKSSEILSYYRDQDLQNGTQRVRNLEELVGAAADYSKGSHGLTAFLEDIELDRMRIEESDVEGENRVTLITMHNTKGLEFDRVIITGLEEGLFPSRRDFEKDELEEERRIFYVSITRAKRELYLTSCRQRRIWGRTELMYPSQFIGEIPAELLTGAAGNCGNSPLSAGYSRGTRVFHDEYGPGTVRGSRTGDVEETVEVVFDSGRTGTFVPEFTPLEKIADDEFA
jgi:DNA helicase II / ATP-dependent DNA helicase PcrA